VPPNQAGYHAALGALAKAKQFEEAVELFEALVISGSKSDVGGHRLQPTDFATTAVIESSTYSPLEAATRLFETLAYKQREGSSADLSEAMQAALKVALRATKDSANATAAAELLTRARKEGLPSEQSCVRAALVACANARRWDMQWYIYTDALAQGLVPEIIATTMVLDGCAKTGDWRRAQRFLDELEVPDVGSFSAAISAYATGGNWKGAIALLDQMVQRGLPPDIGAYTAALTACCRCGELEHAEGLLARLADDGLADLSYPAHRILLEAYITKGDIEKAGELQAVMDVLGLERLAPVAIVDSDEGGRPQRRRFLNVGPMSEELHTLTERVRRKTTYSPQLLALPHDFVRRSSLKEQEASLRKHAEKRAIAELVATGADRLAAKINFHVCVDCHEFFKAASTLLRKPIVIAEPKMTHTFTEGRCSCGDQWRPF
jgi:pentatricopeptide repeat protein